MDYKNITNLFKEGLDSLVIIESRYSDAEKMAVDNFLKRTKWTEEEVAASTNKQRMIDMMKREVKQLSSGDPSGKNKYLQWMVKNAVGKRTQTVVDTVRDFHKNIQRMPKKNIDAYESLEDLQDAILQTTAKKTKKQKKSEIKEGTVHVYEDNKILVIRPLTEEASCQYGKGTKWCISATESENYFNRYTNRGRAFYFIFYKGDPSEEFGLNFNDSQKKNFEKVALVVNNHGNFEEAFSSSNDSILDLDDLTTVYGKKRLNSIFSEIEDDIDKHPPEVILSKREQWRNKCATIKARFTSRDSTVRLMYGLRGHGQDLSVYFFALIIFQVPEEFVSKGDKHTERYKKEIEKRLKNVGGKKEITLNPGSRPNEMILEIRVANDQFELTPEGFSKFAKHMQEFENNKDMINYEAAYSVLKAEVRKQLKEQIKHKIAAKILAKFKGTNK